MRMQTGTITSAPPRYWPALRWHLLALRGIALEPHGFFFFPMLLFGFLLTCVCFFGQNWRLSIWWLVVHVSVFLVMTARITCAMLDGCSPITSFCSPNLCLPVEFYTQDLVIMLLPSRLRSDPRLMSVVSVCENSSVGEEARNICCSRSYP